MNNPVTDPNTALRSRTKYLDIIGIVWISCLLLTIILGPKMIDVGPFKFSVGVLFYPITYIFSDVFTEVYGYKTTRRIIWMGFFILIFTAILTSLALAIPSSSIYQDSAAFQIIFTPVPIFAAVAIVSFWAGEFINSYIMAKVKIITGGKYLWMRTTSSTVAGQTIDNFFGYFLAFSFTGEYSTTTLINLWLSTVAFCSLYEFIATPITYKIVSFLKRAEGLDVYDYGTNFNPFHFDTRNPREEEFIVLPVR